MRRLAALFVLLLIVLARSAPVQAQSDSTALRLGYQPGQTTETIEITLADAASQARVPLFLSYAGQEPLKDALLYARLLDTQGRPVTVGSLQFANPLDNDAALGRISLEPGVAVREVALVLRDLTAFGAFDGFIAFEIGGNSTRIAGLKVSRPAVPVVVIQEANAQKEIALIALGARLAGTFFLKETGGQTAEMGLTLAVSELRAADGRAVTVTLDPGQLTLRPYLAHRVRVQGTLPGTGTYSGLLTVTYGDRQDSYALTVKAQAGEEKLSIDAISPPVAIRPFWPCNSTVTATVRINLSETGGSQAILYPPRLEKLVQVGGGQEGVETKYQGWQVLDKAGQALASQQIGSERGTVLLEPNEVSQVTLEVRSLSQVGQSQGTVWVETASGVRVNDTFNLFVKDDWLLPAIIIFLGALGSYGLRHWLETGRPAAIEEISIRRALDQVTATIPDQADRIRQALQARLEEVLETNRLEPATNVGAELTVVKAILTNYQAVGDALKLGDRLNEFVLADTQRATIQSQLTVLKSDLDLGGLDALANDAQGENGLRRQAKAIRDALAEQSRASLKDAICKLREVLDKEQQALPELDPALAGQLDAADGLLKQAEHALGSPDLEVLRQACLYYNQAQAEYNQIRIARFRKLLTDRPAPRGFDEQSWEPHKETMLDMLARGNYDGAQRYYLRTVLTALHDMAQEAAKLNSKQKTVYEGVEIDAQKALALVDSDPNKAQDEYTRLATLFQNAWNQEGADLGEPGKKPPQALAAAPLGQQVPGQLPALPPAPAPPAIPDMAGLQRRVSGNDRLAVVIVGAVSVLIGLRVLWVGQNTFGSLADYISAFLWGFGMHELNKVALPAAASSLGLSWFNTQAPTGGGGH